MSLLGKIIFTIQTTSNQFKRSSFPNSVTFRKSICKSQSRNKLRRSFAPWTKFVARLKNKQMYNKTCQQKGRQTKGATETSDRLFREAPQSHPKEHSRLCKTDVNISSRTMRHRLTSELDLPARCLAGNIQFDIGHVCCPFTFQQNVQFHHFWSLCDCLHILSIYLSVNKLFPHSNSLIPIAHDNTPIAPIELLQVTYLAGTKPQNQIVPFATFECTHRMLASSRVQHRPTSSRSPRSGTTLSRKQ